MSASCRKATSLPSVRCPDRLSFLALANCFLLQKARRMTYGVRKTAGAETRASRALRGAKGRRRGGQRRNLDPESTIH
jgi:hypothetical protein